MFMPKNLFGAVVGHTNGTIGDVLPLILFARLVGVVGQFRVQLVRAGVRPVSARWKRSAGCGMMTEGCGSRTSRVVCDES
jgi:hypothetical protein